jgi:dihydrolipoamide dehydrogenase
VVGRGTIDVGGVRHTARHLVIATGSDPAMPRIPGLAELEGVWGTHQATSLTAVPQRLLVLGAGPAGVELAQALHRFGSSVVIVEAAEHVLPREPSALGAALGDALRRDGIELALAANTRAVRRDDDEYVLEFDDGSELRGDRLLVATGRRPRVADVGLEAIDVEFDDRGITVDERLSAGDGVWAIGDVTGILPLTYVGEYQGEVVAANILGESRVANYEAVPRVVFTDPQAAAVGATAATYSGTARLADGAKLSTYTRAYAESNGFLTLLSDGARLTGAYALGPEAGEWLQQATLAVRARVPLEVLRDTIQPFPSFSEIYNAALKEVFADVAAAKHR